MFDSWPISFMGGDGGGGAAPLIFGDNGAGLSDSGFSNDFVWGKGYQASVSATMKSIHARIATGAATLSDFRLGLYNATDANTWGTLAGISAPRGGSPANVVISLPLVSPVNIVSGQWYAPFVHSFSGSAFLRTRETTTGRFISDAYSDGAAASAAATSAGSNVPLVWLSTEQITLGTSADITFGPTGSGVGNTAFSAGFAFGLGQVCNTGGTVNYLNIVGSSSSSSSVDYRLVLYEATGPFNWGAKIAETALINGLAINETKKVAIVAPVVLVAGRYYALVVHAGGTLPVRASQTALGRSMSDTFGDGSLATAGATSDFGAVPLMWATTS